MEGSVKLFIFVGGTNNCSGNPLRTCIGHLHILLAHLQSTRPDAQAVFTCIPPRLPSTLTRYFDPAHLHAVNMKIRALNHHMWYLSLVNDSVEFLPHWDVVGHPQETIARDGLHLNHLGVKLLSRNIRDTVRSRLKVNSADFPLLPIVDTAALPSGNSLLVSTLCSASQVCNPSARAQDFTQNPGTPNSMSDVWKLTRAPAPQNNPDTPTAHLTVSPAASLCTEDHPQLPVTPRPPSSVTPKSDTPRVTIVASAIPPKSKPALPHLPGASPSKTPQRARKYVRSSASPRERAPPPTPARTPLPAATPRPAVPPTRRSSTARPTPRFLRSSSFSSSSAAGVQADATSSAKTATAHPPRPLPPRASKRPQCDLPE